MADLSLISLTASPPPPGILIPTGSELMLAGLLVGMGVALGWHRSRAKALRYAGVVVVLTATYYAVIPERSALQGALDRTIIPIFSWAPALLLNALGTPSSVAIPGGFSDRELGRIMRVVEERKEQYLEAWYDYQNRIQD